MKKNNNVIMGQMSLFEDFNLQIMTDKEFDDLAKKVVKTKRELLQQALLFADKDEDGILRACERELAAEGKSFHRTREQYNNKLAVERVEKFILGVAKGIGVFDDWANPSQDTLDSGWGAITEARNRIGKPKSLNDAAIIGSVVKTWIKRYYYSQNGVYVPASERFSASTRNNLKEETAAAALTAARETPTSLNATIEDGEGEGVEKVQQLPDLDSITSESDLMFSVMDAMERLCSKKELHVWKAKVFQDLTPEDLGQMEVEGFEALEKKEQMRIRNNFSKSFQSAQKKLKNLFLNNGELATKFPVITKTLTA